MGEVDFTLCMREDGPFLVPMSDRAKQFLLENVSGIDETVDAFYMGESPPEDVMGLFPDDYTLGMEEDYIDFKNPYELSVHTLH